MFLPPKRGQLLSCAVAETTLESHLEMSSLLASQLAGMCLVSGPCWPSVPLAHGVDGATLTWIPPSLPGLPPGHTINKALPTRFPRVTRKANVTEKLQPCFVSAGVFADAGTIGKSARNNNKTAIAASGKPSPRWADRNHILRHFPGGKVIGCSGRSSKSSGSPPAV